MKQAFAFCAFGGQEGRWRTGKDSMCGPSLHTSHHIFSVPTAPAYYSCSPLSLLSLLSCEILLLYNLFNYKHSQLFCFLLPDICSMSLLNVFYVSLLCIYIIISSLFLKRHFDFLNFKTSIYTSLLKTGDGEEIYLPTRSLP